MNSTHDLYFALIDFMVSEKMCPVKNCCYSFIENRLHCEVCISKNIIKSGKIDQKLLKEIFK